MSSKAQNASRALLRRLSRLVVVSAASTVVLASGAGMSAAYAAADNSTGNAGTSGTYNQPQPLSTADQNTGGANGGCSTDPTGIYCSTRDGSPSGNGNQDTGQHTGEPCAGCEGNADNKNPPGQETSDPGGIFPDNGFECDNNNGIGQTNPAHTGCQPGLTGTCIAATATTGGVTWVLTNGNSFSVTANWTSGSQSGSVTIPAATPVDNKTSTPGTVTFTTTGTSVKVTFPNNNFTEIDKTLDCPPPPAPLTPLTLAGDCVDDTTPTWTLTNSNDSDVAAHWVSGALSGDVTVPANGTKTFTTTGISVTVTFPGTDLTALSKSMDACPPPSTPLTPLTLAGNCVDDTTPTWTLTNSNDSDVAAHWVSGAQSGDVTVPANGTKTFTTTGTSVTVTFPGTDLTALSKSMDACPPGPPTQTVSGVIDLCTGAMAPSAGSLLTVESTSVSSVNPLAETPVAAGEQAVDAVAPTGYHFVSCNATTQTIVTPTTAQETVNVPAGGTNQAVFYVAQDEPVPPATLSLTVVKSNDADVDGVFHDTETAHAAGQDVTFEAQILNNSQVALVIDSIADAFSGSSQAECASLIGTTLGAGQSVLCTFTIADYSPAAGGSLTDTVTVVGHEAGHPDNSTQGSDTSTVLTPTPPTAGAPDLAIVKVASKTSVKAGDLLTYTLTVSNVGEGATTGTVTVTDTVPSGLSVGGVNGGADWTCGTSGQTVTCTYNNGAIAAGQTVGTITINTAVLSSASGVLTNTGVVSTPGDTNATNDTSTVKTPVTTVLGEKIPQTPGTPGTPGTPDTPSTPSTPTVSPSVLPMTGTGVTALLPLAMGFLTVGLLLMVAGVRRRRA